MDKSEIKEILKEIEILKEREREGWNIRGLPSETIAEHSYGTAIFTYILSDIIPEVDKEICLSLALFHDFLEAKTSDFDEITKKYLDKNKVEEKALKDSPDKIKELLNKYNGKKEAKIVKDADKLDMMNRAKKLRDLGYSKEILDDFIENEFYFEESEEVFDLINSN